MEQKPYTQARIRNILLIEDDKDDQLVFKAAMKIVAPEISCETASNGQEALDLLLASKVLPQLVFLDLKMPEMDGFSFLMMLRKHPRIQFLPVGVITGSSVLSAMRTSKGLGARFYLTKPSDFGSLCTKLGKILAVDYSRVEFSIVI